MNDKPYRPNVGVALFNAEGKVLIGRRFKDDGPEIILPGLEWQMPQGGIDAEEDPHAAVMRELWEETGAVSASYLAENFGADGPGLLPEFAPNCIARVLFGIDAALGHLPFEAGQDDLGSVIPEAPADQHAALRVEQRDADIGAIGFFGGHAL